MCMDLINVLNIRHDNIDIAIIRENTEGEYSGLEHEVYTHSIKNLCTLCIYKYSYA